MVIAVPSLDGIKRAVELKLGLALLPRRCAITEIASGRLAAIPVSGLAPASGDDRLPQGAPVARGGNRFSMSRRRKTPRISPRHRTVDPLVPA